MLFPAIGASFYIGRDIIYKKLDISDSIVKTYFVYLKASMKLLRFFSVNTIIVLNIICMVIMANSGHYTYSVICLVITALLLSFMFYIAGYHTFVNEKINLTEVVISMFTKVHLLIMIFIVYDFVCYVFRHISNHLRYAIISIFILEIPIFIQMIHLQKLTGRLDNIINLHTW